MGDKRDIAIVGPGVVGTTLGILASRAGYRVVGVAGRNEAKARAAAEAIGRGVNVGRADQIAPAAMLVLLTVPDDAIGSVCRELAEAGAFARGGVIAHCSGAVSSEVLAPARERCGAAVGSMHPLQTFPSVALGLVRFAGTYCFCEGDEEATKALTALARAIGGKPVRISPASKGLYHAAAVMACNYLTALLDAALAAAEHAGIPRADALAAMGPLVRATVENVMAQGPAGALTGPIARGDERVVKRQLRELAAADAELADVYRALGRWTVELALRKGSIDPEKASRLRMLFSGKPKDE
jgi:predicted short-subunit dehydrogenase-like oxidoreductase (DUF2520 family)